MSKQENFNRKLKSKYPLLYRDVYGDPQRTCMAFGADVDEGWFPLIEELSEKLESLVRELKDEVKKSPNLKCENCWRTKEWHWWFVFIGYIWIFLWRLVRWPKTIIKQYQHEREFSKKHSDYGYKFRWRRVFRLPYRKVLCNKFRIPYPCAAQIKEKFGTLRFYMTYYNEPIEKIISEYANKSRYVCEKCGAAGKLREERSWILTLCDECESKK